MGDEADDMSAITPTEYERLVASLLCMLDPAVEQWRVVHQDVVEAADGSFALDVTVRFRTAGLDFLVVVECKHWRSPVSRDEMLTLHEKMRAVRAQKAVLVCSSDFQRGALDYARANGMACVLVRRGRPHYLVRHGTASSGRSTSGTGFDVRRVLLDEDDQPSSRAVVGTADVRSAFFPGHMVHARSLR